MRKLYKSLYILTIPKNIGNLRHRYNLHLIVQGLSKAFQRNETLFIRLQEGELSPFFFCNLLPGNQVTVVLHNGNQDLVPLFQKCSSITLCH